jgi:ribosomal protein S18 acetylase RimI-like enzyme
MVNSRITIRQANSDDIAHLTALLAVLFSIEDDFSFDAEKQKAGLTLMVGEEQSCVFVAEQRGIIIGMCTGQLTLSTAEGGPAVLVEDVVVKEEWRSLGVGKRLMDELTRWAYKSGATRMQLLADKSNTGALGFYADTGWKSTQLICLRKHIR